MGDGDHSTQAGKLYSVRDARYAEAWTEGWREETLGIFYQSWGKYVFSGVWPKRQSNEEKVVCVVIS